MGFGSILGKIGSIAGAPFTGGLSLIPLGLEIAGDVAKGRAAGREAEGAARANAQQQALQAAAFNRQQPFFGAGAGVRGDVLSNVQPFQLTGSGRDLRGSGGLSPALLSGGTRQIGQNMNRQALLASLGQGGTPFSTIDTAQYAPPQAGLLDKILGGAGIAGAGLGILNEAGALKKPKSKAPAASGINPAFQTRQPLF